MSNQCSDQQANPPPDGGGLPDCFVADEASGGWRCTLCPGSIMPSREEASSHIGLRRHRRAVDQARSSQTEYIQPIDPSPGADSGGGQFRFRCALCATPITDKAACRAHANGKKHRRLLRQSLWQSSVLDPRCEPPCHVHCLGDSHGGKYCFANMSSKVTYYYTRLL
jgi:hypothetical protein